MTVLPCYVVYSFVFCFSFKWPPAAVECFFGGVVVLVLCVWTLVYAPFLVMFS